MAATTNSFENETDQALFQAIQQGLKGLRYGSLEIIVHDGKVVQIERRERVRLADSKRSD